jgi:hypothetical protein
MRASRASLVIVKSTRLGTFQKPSKPSSYGMAGGPYHLSQTRDRHISSHYPSAMPLEALPSGLKHPSPLRPA